MRNGTGVPNNPLGECIYSVQIWICGPCTEVWFTPEGR